MCGISADRNYDHGRRFGAPQPGMHQGTAEAWSQHPTSHYAGMLALTLVCLLAVPWHLLCLEINSPPSSCLVWGVC